MPAARLLASLIAPPRCGICAASCGWRELICRTCETALWRMPRSAGPGPPGVEMAMSVGPYEGVMRRLITAIKFSGRLSLVAPAATVMREILPMEGVQPAIVPVPAEPRRAVMRGYDLAEELARILARDLKAGFAPCLDRAQGPPQVGRRRPQRLANPPQVYPNGSVPAAALLVDDVTTTGATLAACASALRSAGASTVVAATLARA